MGKCREFLTFLATFAENACFKMHQMLADFLKFPVTGSREFLARLADAAANTCV
jgi:hypothetical protein